MVEELIARLVDGSVAGPLLGFAIGALLGVSPVAWPTLPLVVGVVSPGQVNERGERVRPSLLRVFPSIVAFAAGMNGVLGLVGYAFVTVAVAVARAAVALNLVAATVMGVLGLRLLLRRTSLCKRAEAIPPRPAAAFAFGVAFSVGARAVAPSSSGSVPPPQPSGDPVMGWSSSPPSSWATRPCSCLPRCWAGGSSPAGPATSPGRGWIGWSAACSS